MQIALRIGVTLFGLGRVHANAPYYVVNMQIA